MSTASALFRARREAIAEVFRNPDLRRLELGWGGFFLVEWTSLVAVSIWAYGEGGAKAVGLVGLMRLLPAAVALPFGAAAADRFPRHRVLAAVFVGQALALASTAAAIAVDSPAALVYTLVALAGVLAAPCRPAQLALAPLLARSPRELVAANVTAGTLEGAATLLGPALAGILLAVTGAAPVLAAAAAASAVSAAIVGRITLATDPSRTVAHTGESALASVLGGLREIRRNGDIGLIVGGFVAQLFVRGLLNVLLVSVSFVLLDYGDSGVGWLSAMIGAGGLAGAFVAVWLTGRRRLAGIFVLGLVLWGLPIAAIGLAAKPFVAFIALAAVGLGNTLLDVSGFTMLQRLGDDRALGRVFGVFYALGIGAAGLGSLLAPALIDLLSLRSALVAVGLFLPAVAIAALPRLRAIDARSDVPAEQLQIVSSVPLLAPLPPTTLEKVAARASLEEVREGGVIIREGEVGNCFYVIASGVVDVASEGRSFSKLGAGEYFGEIALLHDLPRTATVTADGDTRLLVLSREVFLAAVCGSERGEAVAREVSHARLGRDRNVPTTARGPRRD